MKTNDASAKALAPLRGAIQFAVRDILDADWDLMIAHPPCTHLAVIWRDIEHLSNW